MVVWHKCTQETKCTVISLCTDHLYIIHLCYTKQQLHLQWHIQAFWKFESLSKGLNNTTQLLDYLPPLLVIWWNGVKIYFFWWTVVLPLIIHVGFNKLEIKEISFLRKISSFKFFTMYLKLHIHLSTYLIFFNWITKRIFCRAPNVPNNILKYQNMECIFTQIQFLLILTFSHKYEKKQIVAFLCKLYIRELVLSFMLVTIYP